HGHDSAIAFSRHPGAGRDPCFHTHLSLIASATVSHRTAPRRLHYGSRPAPGWRNLQRTGDEGQLDYSLFCRGDDWVSGRDSFTLLGANDDKSLRNAAGGFGRAAGGAKSREQEE